MTGSATDRNLLFAVLAFQLHHIDQTRLTQLIRQIRQDAGFNPGEQFVQQQLMTEDERRHIDALVDQQMRSNGGQLQQTLHEVSLASDNEQDLVQTLSDALRAPETPTIVSDVANPSDPGSGQPSSDADQTTPSDNPDEVQTLTGVPLQKPAAADATFVSDPGQQTILSDDPPGSGVSGSAQQSGSASGSDAPVAGDSGSSTGHGEADRYRVLRSHARGGLGEVAVALDQQLNREVALKRIQQRHLKNRTSCDRFVQEAEITGLLEHPGVVPIYGLGKDSVGRPYYTMRFIRGESLQQAIKQLSEPEDQASHQWLMKVRRLLRHFVDVCNTMAYAHSRGVIHRDLKPDNVMLGLYGETLVVDWGLAKVLGSLSNPEIDHPDGELSIDSSLLSGGSHTIAGRAMGTPTYMSPEQATGNLDLIGPPSDIFSLGATLFCLLTGRSPYQSTGGIQKVLAKAATCDYPRPRELNPKIPPALEAICVKAMSRDITDRYETARQLAEDLEHWMADEPVTAYHDSLVERVSRLARRYRSAVRVSAVSLVIISIGAVMAAVLINNQKNVAVTARANESLARSNAVRLAEERRVLAVQERESRLAAERQLRIATSLRLASLAQTVRDTFPIESLLLAREAVKITDRHHEPILPVTHQTLRTVLNAVGGEPLKSHSGDLYCVAISADSRRLITGSADRTAKIWSLSSEGTRELFTLVHGAQILEAQFSGDGRRVVTGGNDGSLKLWTWTDPAQPPDSVELKRHSEEVRAIAFSPDQQWLATAGGSEIHLWRMDALDGSPLEVRFHSGAVNSLVFSSDSQLLYSAGADRVIAEWSLENIDPETPSRQLAGHTDAINQLVVNESRTALFSCASDRTVVGWDLTEPEPAAVVYGDNEGLALCLSLSSDGRWLASGSDRGSVDLWDLASESPVESRKSLLGHRAAVRWLGFLPASNSLVTVSSDETARIWDAGARDPAQSFQVLLGHEGPVAAGTASADAHWLVTAGYDRSARVWDVSKGSPISPGQQLPQHKGQIPDNAISSDGRWIATASWDRTVRLTRLTPRGILQDEFILEGHTAFVQNLAFDPQGYWLASAGWDKTVRLWDLSGDDPAQDPLVLEGHEQFIKALEFSSDGRWLFSADASGEIRRWQLPADGGRGPVSSQAMREHRGVVQTLALSPDGKHLASAGEDLEIRIWDLTGDTPTTTAKWVAHERPIRRLVFDPPGRRLFSGSADSTVKVWDWLSENPGEPLAVLAAHNDAVTDLAISPNGHWLVSTGAANQAVLWDLKVKSLSESGTQLSAHEAEVASVVITADSRWAVTASRDRTVRIWDLQADDPAALSVVISDHRQRISALAVSSTGSLAVSSSSDGISWLWNLDPQSLLDQAEQRAGRELTDEERRKYAIFELP